MGTTPPVTRDAANSAIAERPEETDPNKDAALHAAEAVRVELDGRKRFFKLRETWSGWIIAWITGLIIFNSVLTILVGAGKLDFAAYPWFVTAVTIETFLQVVGLGYIAVRYLFSKG